jgi:hypothetical protein
MIIFFLSKECDGAQPSPIALVAPAGWKYIVVNSESLGLLTQCYSPTEPLLLTPPTTKVLSFVALRSVFIVMDIHENLMSTFFNVEKSHGNINCVNITDASLFYSHLTA